MATTSDTTTDGSGCEGAVADRFPVGENASGASGGSRHERTFTG
ncbi:hypothetical protein L195_g014003 [Trifolium pratense]|uniref:Uncharacterized protein n=1 Tax=Trifolium pratense TaxID=57577 RepID=A0A2K3PPS4_TRIPR|nr:hypothetical protein L195_g014003 [Trifolium pratense]